MKVSVIVPVYNVEEYLPKCLDSLVNQTLEDIEIIVVNDGSTDNSQKIIDQYTQKYPQIISLTKENGGLGDARNHGVDQAKGEFLAFVDSDDYISPNMMEEMYDLAKNNNAQIALCNIQKVNEKGEVTQIIKSIPNISGAVKLKDNFSIFGDLSYFACNKIFDRKLFNQKRFQKGMHFEDIELIPKLVLDSETLVFTQSIHYNYFERSGSITKTHNEKGLDILKAVKSVEDYFYKSNYKNEKKGLESFQIFQGVYSFLAYLAYVKDEKIYSKIYSEYICFLQKHTISISKILIYRRFKKNYILSLHIKKLVYYLLFFLGQKSLIRRFI